MNNQTENLLSPPPLTPSLNSAYLSFNSDMRRLFVKIYHHLWNYVNPLSRFTGHGGVLYSFWVVDLLRVRLGLTSSELAILSYLYQITDKGTNTIHSDSIYNSAVLPHVLKQSKGAILYDLKCKGFISRSTRNLSEPYLSRSYSSHPLFISLTSSGVRVIEGIEKDLYKILLNTSLNELTGTNRNT
jgi:hypothetical protein